MPHHATAPVGLRLPRHVSVGGRLAFTLAELLVVVTIIVALLAMLIPSIETATAQSRTIKCMGMQRQLWVANTAYADDSTGWYVLIKGKHYYMLGRRVEGNNPSTTVDETQYTYDQVWFRNTHYLKLLGVDPDRLTEPVAAMAGDDPEAELTAAGWWPSAWACPEARAYRLRDLLNPQDLSVNLWDAYGFNWSGVTPSWTNEIGVRVSQVRHPGSAAQMTDTNDWHTTGIDSADYVRYWDRYGFEPKMQKERHNLTRVIQYRHLEGAAIMHFDGHSAYYHKTDAWDLSSKQARDMLWKVYH
jgi:hypothetical protein